MISENVRELVRHRLSQADESVAAAALLAERSLHRAALNRAYYAMFYAVLAVLAVSTQETSRHSGAISLFDKEFVRTALVERDFSRWLHEAFNLRQRSDYAADFVPSGEDVNEAVIRATAFVRRLKELVANLGA